MKTYKIHLIRHGITESNLSGTYTGQKDIPLCEQGIAQLEQMARDFDYSTPQAVFCSPLQRCIKTANIIYKDMNPIIINELIEYDFGEFEGKTAADLKDSDEFKYWISGDANAAPPFGESNKQFGKRICTAFIKIVDGLLKTGTTEASIVAHGGVIMGLLHCFAIPELPMTEWLCPNGCGYTICINPSLWCRMQKFEVMGEAPFIPEEFEPSEDTAQIPEKINKKKKYGFFETIKLD